MSDEARTGKNDQSRLWFEDANPAAAVRSCKMCGALIQADDEHVLRHFNWHRAMSDELHRGS